MTELLLIRHGQATHNVAGRWEGWSEVPLTPDGQRQAEALARRLAKWLPPVDQIYTSPLPRAWQTAQAIARALKLSPVPSEGLREINFGQVGGHTMDTFRESMPEVYARWQNRADMAFQFPGGEQRQAFFRRVARALDEIVEQHSGEQVALVAHGGTLRAGLAHLFPETMRDWWSYTLDNASLTHVRVEHGTKALLALNDCQHLGEP